MFDFTNLFMYYIHIMEIGNKIRQLRIQRGLTQEELASRCELTKGYISQLENDIASPSIATLLDILNVLGVTVQEFFGEEKERKSYLTRKTFLSRQTVRQRLLG